MKHLLVLFSLFVTIYAQEENKYLRKSISHLEVLFRLDRTSQVLSETEKTSVIRSIQSNLNLGRFDFNPVPESIVQSLVEEGRSFSATEVQDLSPLLDKILAPSVRETVIDSSMGRSEDIQSQFQKETFIATKAKSLDITGKQYDKILNSSYLYIPTVSDVSIQSKWFLEEQGYRAQMTIGIAWFKLVFDDQGESHYELITHIQSKGIGEASGRGPSNYRARAFTKAVFKATKNLVFETQNHPDFKLKGQLLEDAMRSAEMDLGLLEGLYQNQRFRFFELVESSDSTERRDVGWGFVGVVNDSTSELGLVSGFAEQGQSVEEIPLSGIQIFAGYQTNDWSLQKPPFSEKAPETYQQGSVFLGTSVDLSRSSFLNHSFLTIRGLLSSGTVNGVLADATAERYRFNSFLMGNLEVGFAKNFHLWNRFYLGGEVGLGLYRSALYMDDLNNAFDDLTSEWFGNTFRASLVFNVELTPQLSLLGSLGQQYSNVWYQEYVDDDNSSYCHETALGCFDADYGGKQISLSFEYRMGRLNEFYQRMF